MYIYSITIVYRVYIYIYIDVYRIYMLWRILSSCPISHKMGKRWNLQRFRGAPSCAGAPGIAWRRTASCLGGDHSASQRLLKDCWKIVERCWKIVERCWKMLKVDKYDTNMSNMVKLPTRMELSNIKEKTQTNLHKGKQKHNVQVIKVSKVRCMNTE